MSRAASSSASPHFLGVLVAERIISEKQARRIAAVQDSIRGAGIDPYPKVGEIGIDRGCLTEASRDKGLARLEAYRTEGRTCSDPISAFHRQSESVLSFRGSAALGALIAVTMSATWLATHSWELTSIAATLACALVTALEKIAPAVVDGRILWYRYVRTIAVVSMVMSFGYGIGHFQSLPWPFLVSLGVLGVCAFYFCGVAMWRRWEVRALDARQYATRALLKNSTAGLQHGAITPERQTAQLNALLTGAVQLLSLNIYGRLAAGAMRWKNPSASAISVWYLRRRNSTSQKLEIHAYSCSTVAPDIKAAYDKICAHHQPSCLNRQRFDDVWAECQRIARGTSGEHLKCALRLFRDQVERRQYVSLAG